MKRAYLAIFAMTLATTVLLATISLASAQFDVQAQRVNSDGARSGMTEGALQSDGDGPAIQNTERISIPFGITDTLPLRDNGQSVVVIGHGSCTAGETVAVAITVTQSATGASATGQTVQSCAGEETLQVWSLIATTGGYPLQAGQAEVCGLATSYAGDVATDTFAWCRPDVTLAWPHYLPVFLKQS